MWRCSVGTTGSAKNTVKNDKLVTRAAVIDSHYHRLLFNNERSTRAYIIMLFIQAVYCERTSTSACGGNQSDVSRYAHAKRIRNMYFIGQMSWSNKLHGQGSRAFTNFFFIFRFLS